MGVPDLMMTPRTEAALGLRKPFREFLADLGAHAPRLGPRPTLGARLTARTPPLPPKSVHVCWCPVTRPQIVPGKKEPERHGKSVHLLGDGNSSSDQLADETHLEGRAHVAGRGCGAQETRHDLPLRAAHPGRLSRTLKRTWHLLRAALQHQGQLRLPAARRPPRPACQGQEHSWHR